MFVRFSPKSLPSCKRRKGGAGLNPAPTALGVVEGSAFTPLKKGRRGEFKVF